VEAPVLLPTVPIAPVSGKCKKNDLSVVLTLVVDASGQPRMITFSSVSQPLSPEMEELARQTISDDRFKPGTRDGRAVAVEVSVEVRMYGCVEHASDSLGNKIDHFRFRSQPLQKLEALPEPPGGIQQTVAPVTSAKSEGGNVYQDEGKTTGPVPLNRVEAQYTDAARKARINGICLVKVIVDAAGMPQSPMVVHSLDQGLDQKAIEAVMKYRFKPAMRNGRPIPVMITLEINFQIGN
jgi:TonB family protein